MKILRLDLIAFGPFTATALDLSAGSQGLHLVYGPNEAGKTSALRALRQMLYGIPERSADGFRHPFAKLRIGGVLRSAAGDVLAVIRRKGRAGTLRGADDQSAVEERELQRFLNGVDAGLFTTMFGIGYEDLVTGGREIVRGGGDVGRLIFAAGSGAAHLGAVVDGLRAEADALFRPAGQKQKINEALGRLRQRRAALKEAQLPGAEWLRHDQALREAEQRKTFAEEGRGAARRSLNRLQRIGAALPVIAKRREALKRIESVADAALLPEGFSERRSDALTRLSVAQSEHEQAQANLAGLRLAMSELAEPSIVLAHAEAIEALHQELGSRRKADRDRIAIETRRNTLRTEARQALRRLRDDLTIDEAERLRIKRPEAVRIQELGAEFERIETRIEEARRQIPEHARQLAAVEAQIQPLAPPRPFAELKTALASAEEILPLEKQLSAARAEAGTLVQGCGQIAARLGLAAVPAGELEGLPVPPDETLRVFEERLEGLERRVSALAEATRKCEIGLSETARRIEQARLEREVPTEADLRAAREVRDRGWRLICRRLEGADLPQDELKRFSEAFPERTTLAAAFEAGMARADETADRLRREADRVAEKARLLADREAGRAAQAQLAEELAAARSEEAAALSEWSGVWRPLGVQARSPREMRHWVADFRALRDKSTEVFKRAAQCDAFQAEIAAGRKALSRGLEALDEPAAGEGEALAGLVQRCRRMIEDAEALVRRREELGRDRSRLSGELETLNAHLGVNEAERRRWQAQWEQAVRPLGLDAAALPAEAGAVMEELTGLFEKLQRAEVEQKRMDGIDRDAEAFSRKVGGLAAAVVGDLAGRPADEGALELQRRLTQAREAHSRRQALQEQIGLTADALRRSAGAIAGIESLLKAMCAEAGCSDPAGLPEAERRSDLRRRLDAELRELDERLIQLSGGAEPEEFIREAAAVDPDAMAGEVERLKSEIGRLTAEISGFDQTIGRERAELGRMDGGDKAAAVAEEIQAILGGLENDVAHYARLKIAARILETAVERFRRKSQGPILGKASEYFRRITCGSFEGIRADRDGDGTPAIVGVRPEGRETVAVQAMSDGTADQLFLALRLAGLEHYLDANEPMPFIVDDILVKFDDERAAAAIQVLAELSRKTQVIFFTHHRHLVELASETLPGSVLVEHRLSTGQPG